MKTDLKVGIITNDRDASITEEELQSLADDDLVRWKEKIDLSREDLFHFSRGQKISLRTSSLTTSS
jgi:hypothetical protein